jgi:hypothetical protein
MQRYPPFQKRDFKENSCIGRGNINLRKQPIGIAAVL